MKGSKEATTKGSGRQQDTRARGGNCHELAFFTFFSPKILQHLQSLYFKILSYQATYTRSFHFICSLCLQITKSTCIESHNVADTTLKTTMDDPFQPKRNNKLYGSGLSPRQDDRIDHPFQDRRVHTVAHQRANQGIAF